MAQVMLFQLERISFSDLRQIVTAMQARGFAPFELAVQLSDTESMRLLGEHGFDFNCQPERLKGFSPLGFVQFMIDRHVIERHGHDEHPELEGLLCLQSLLLSFGAACPVVNTTRGRNDLRGSRERALALARARLLALAPGRADEQTAALRAEVAHLGVFEAHRRISRPPEAFSARQQALRASLAQSESPPPQPLSVPWPVRHLAFSRVQRVIAERAQLDALRLCICRVHEARHGAASCAAAAADERREAGGDPCSGSVGGSGNEGPLERSSGSSSESGGALRRRQELATYAAAVCVRKLGEIRSSLEYALRTEEDAEARLVAFRSKTEAAVAELEASLSGL